MLIDNFTEHDITNTEDIRIYMHALVYRAEYYERKVIFNSSDIFQDMFYTPECYFILDDQVRPAIDPIVL